jgi:hypothetical protein
MKRAQCGYLLEIPILVALVVIVALVLGPMLPKLGQKIAAIIAGLVVMGGAYYDLIIPGWQPRKRLRAPWNWIVFVVVASVTVIGAAAFALH